MKTKTLLTVLMIGMIMGVSAQKPTMELTFTAQNTGQYVPLDSILIENLTQGVDTTLYAPDTVLVLDYITSIANKETIKENTFSVSQNYPNPFKGKTEVNVYLPEKENIKMAVRDILGRELVQYENQLNRGNHVFSFSPGNEKYYLLTVTGKQASLTIKMLNADSKTIYGGKCKIVYNGFEDNEIVFKSQQAINDFVYTLGDELQFSAYALTEIGNIGSAIETDSPVNNTTYEFNILGGVRCPGIPTITDIDGNVYNTVLIGSQCWMKENLITTTYRNGTAIPNVTDANAWSNLTTGAYVWYDNDISWKDSYGALYNWFATVDVNSLCPSGWHVPTDDEWTALTDYIGGTGSPHGNELKSCRQVNSPLGGGCNTSEHPRWHENNYEWGTDDYGFSGLPGGYRFTIGYFYEIGDLGLWWSSTEYSSSSAWGRGLGYFDGYVSVYGYPKQDGFSVRCLRDN